MKSILKRSLVFLILNYKSQNPHYKTCRSEELHKRFPFPWPLGPSGLCCFLKPINTDTRLQKLLVFFLECQWFQITALSSTWQGSLMAAFPSREIPTCRFSSAAANQQVGFTHLVKEIVSRSSGPTYQINAQSPHAILHPSLQNAKVVTEQSAKIICEAMMPQALEKWWKSPNSRESGLGSHLYGAGATKSHLLWFNLSQQYNHDSSLPLLPPQIWKTIERERRNSRTEINTA